MLKPVNLLLIFLLPHLLPPTLSNNASGQESLAVQEDTGNVTKDGSSTEDTEETDELAIEIGETEKERERVRERLGFLDKRLRLLRKRQQLEKKRLNMEQQIEAAEERDTEPDAEIEQQWQLLELESEEISINLELLHKRSELSALRQRYAEQELDSDDLDFQKMDRAISVADKLTKLFLESIRKGDDEQAEQTEVRMEELEHEYEIRQELLHLKLELRSAEKEGDEEWMQELKLELRNLEQEINPESGPNGTTKDSDNLSNNMPKPVLIDAAIVAEAKSWTYRQHIQPILKRHCHECHSDESASGDLNLLSLAEQKPWVVNRSHWKNISQQIRMRTMPPTDSEPMSDADRSAIAGFLQHKIDNFDYETVRQPGYEPARRLTHEEYNHTIRDLFGIDLRPADRFPRELTASSGFANSANSLFMQPIILERYLGAAEQVIESAMPDQADTAELQKTRNLLLGSKSAAEAITHFGRRAFRRPMRDGELKPLLNYYSELTGQNPASVTDNKVSYKALGQVFEVILASPSFLFRSETDQSKQSKQAFRITDHELASRLSYFLWATMPDDQLNRTADAGTLRDPRVLAAEVNRMLADPKSNTLGEIFASQWLGFGALPHAPRDPIDNPWATDSLVDALQQESALFFSSLVKENQPIERLIDAKYTFINEELARHYDLDQVSGSEMRRVSLESSPRSGILGQGSILAITSFPNRTSPVVRGNWILTELLGTPPPPPPPNVSQFDDRVAERRNLSQRQKLELHRNNPNCYACHAQIDPLGFALEQYDWFGRFKQSRRGSQPDTRGMLPGGTEFRGLPGLQKALIDERRDQLVEQITRKMLTYALGRQLEYFDESVIKGIIQQVEDDDRRLQTLIHAIVTSDTFQMKQLAR
jgi:mono/diheme cytochrome c family protein